MGPRTLIVWGAVAIVSTVAAIYASVESSRNISVAGALDEPVFPELVAAPEAAVQIAVEQGGQRLTVARGDGAWVVPERWDYAADETAVRALVTDLVDLRYAAPRTALPERFARLEVDEPGEGSAATRVTIEAADGTVLADAILGKGSDAITRDRRGVYLRLPDGERAWLASGTVDVATDVIDWLDTDLPSIARDELALLTVSPASDEGLTAGRVSKDDEMTLTTPVPDGRQADAESIRRLTGMLADLRFDELKPAADVAWPEAWTRIEASRFDDTSLELELATIDDARWVRFADDANWVYRLPAFQLDRIDLSLEELLEPPSAS